MTTAPTKTNNHRRGPENTARDIANSAYEDVIGPRPARHRKEPQA